MLTSCLVSQFTSPPLSLGLNTVQSWDDMYTFYKVKHNCTQQILLKQIYKYVNIFPAGTASANLSGRKVKPWYNEYKMY